MHLLAYILWLFSWSATPPPPCDMEDETCEQQESTFKAPTWLERISNGI